MTYNTKALGLAAALALAPMVASAATVDITFQSFGSFNSSDFDKAGAIAAQTIFMGSTRIGGAEDFEGFTNCPDATCASADNTTPIVSSKVGDFYRIGGASGSGNSQVAPTDKIVVRMNNPTNTFSRYDVVGGQNWLDSNDHKGIRWEIPGSSGLSKVFKIAFFLTDVDDVRSVDFSIAVDDGTPGGSTLSPTISGIPTSGAPDGELQLVTMLFSNPVDILNIDMIAGSNDGFGVDGIQVGTVPLPASALLLLGGLGGLGGMSALRRRTRAA